MQQWRPADSHTTNRNDQSGNIIMALFAAVGMVGILGVAMMTLIRGPVTSMHNVTQHSIVENDLIAAAALLSQKSLAQTGADCDSDGDIEPLAPAAPSLPASAPAGGGVIPTSVAATRLDPWKSAYGYCAWDIGSKVKAGLCADDSGRRAGAPGPDNTVIAVISAGPDRTFQTSCTDYVDDATSLVRTPAGSDDVVRVLSYGQFLLPRMATARLQELPDEACTAQTIGTMRLSVGVVQTCMDTGWEEVGTAAQANTGFTPVTNAALGTVFTSNTISFAGFLGTKTIETVGNATLLINGVVKTSPAQIVAGDDVALRATSDAVPESTLTFGVSAAGVKKTWTITTRDRTPANLTLTPPSAANIWADGTSGTAYSPAITFTVENTGEDRAVLNAPSLSNIVDFEITGNTCAAATLGLNETCTVTVRAKATATTASPPFTANLTVSGATEHYAGTASKIASLSGDALFPVTLATATAVNLSSVPAFTTYGRWAANRPKQVVIPSGVTIGSTNPAIPALQSGTGFGNTLTVTNSGSIDGAGGQPNGGVGGTALLAAQSGIAVVNTGSGKIRAGGGAGGLGGNGGGGKTGGAATDGPVYNYGTYYYETATGDRAGAGPVWNGAYVHNDGTYTYNIGSLQWTWGDSGGGGGGGNPSWYVTYYEYSITRSYNTTAYTAGGTGGVGGRGQGYDGAYANGVAGTAGGTNAGNGGAGGNGGAWGLSGANGNTGASGNNGAGTAGSAGGLAGYAIQNIGNVTLTNSGQMLGR